MRQGTPEWLEWRRGGVGSSDAPIVEGVSPYMTAYELSLVKRGYAPEQAEQPHMRRGKENEAPARAAWEKRTGLIVQPQCLEHPKHPWMRASVDGMTFDGSLAIEIKNNRRDLHDLAKRGEVPLEHFPQVQHILAVGGFHVLHYFSWREDDPEGALVEVFPESAYIANLIQHEELFWKRVLKDEDPPLTERDTHVRLDADWAALADEYRKAEAICAEWGPKKEALKEALVAQMGDLARVTGGGVALTRYWRKGSVDYARIPILEGVNLDPYRRKASMQVRVTVAKEA